MMSYSMDETAWHPIPQKYFSMNGMHPNNHQMNHLNDQSIMNTSAHIFNPNAPEFRPRKQIDSYDAPRAECKMKTRHNYSHITNQKYRNTNQSFNDSYPCHTKKRKYRNQQSKRQKQASSVDGNTISPRTIPELMECVRKTAELFQNDWKHDEDTELSFNTQAPFSIDKRWAFRTSDLEPIPRPIGYEKNEYYKSGKQVIIGNYQPRLQTDNNYSSVFDQGWEFESSVSFAGLRISSPNHGFKECLSHDDSTQYFLQP